MFKDFKWAEKLPLFISVKVDDILIAKSQVLNVPIAEYAKLSGVLTPEILCDNKLNIQLVNAYGNLSFNNDGGCYYIFDYYRSEGYWDEGYLNYSIDGNDIILRGEITQHGKGDNYPFNEKKVWIGTYYPTINLLLIDRSYEVDRKIKGLK